ncbi:MAG TPA: hypothetical protein VGG28_24800 [Kofleriaceae bacterium]
MKWALLVFAVACSKPAAPHADRFWPFFVAHADQLRAEPLEPAMDQLQSALEVDHHGVIAELASLRDDRTLVLTADGDRAAFPDVQALYAARPTVPHWTIVAFRQRDPARPLVAITSGSGATFDPNPIRYVADRTSDGKLDVALFVPGYTERDAKLVYIALDHLVGEYDVETKLASIAIAPLDKAPAMAKPIAELPSDVDALGSGA